MDSSFLTFLGISLLVIVTPGPDTALTIRNTLLGGRSTGIFTAIGVSAGQLVWAIATSAGLVAILLASEAIFYAVKLAGAAYLVVLGVHSIVAAFRADRAAASSTEGGMPVPLPSLAAFRQGQGTLSALVLLGIVFSALTFVWLAFYATAVAAVGGFLRRRNTRRVVEGVAGAVLIGLGLRLAMETR